jgi:phosphoadenosine phosphosulfate reductase
VEQIIISLSQEELSMSETQSVTPKPTSIQLQKIADEMENKSARDILKWAIDTYGLKIGLASSFGAEDVVLIDMMININKVKTKIFTLDTGRLDQETYDIMDDIRKKYDIRIKVYFPDQNEVEEMVRAKGMNLMYANIENRN